MSDPSAFWPVITLLVGIVAWLWATRLQLGRMVGPFSLGLAVLLSIFAIRPILMIGVGDFSFYGLDVRDGFNKAALIGLIAVVSFCIGYALLRRVPAPPPGRYERSLPVMHGFIFVLLCTGLWFVMVAALGGGLGTIPLLFAGRSALAKSVLTGAPVLIFAIPCAGAVVQAVARVTTERVRALRPTETLAFWAGILISCAPAVAQGARRFLLPVLLVGVLAAVLPRWHRLVSLRWLVTGLFGVFVLMCIPYIRSAGSRTDSKNFIGAIFDYGSTQGLSGVLSNYFLTYDTEMFNYVSYLAPRLGSGIPYGAGRGTVGDLVLNPLPTSLLTTPLWSDRLLTSIFGGTCATQACPVPSMPGVLLYDLGIVGVIVGMVLAGMVVARVETRLPMSTGLALPLLLSLAAFFPVLLRGNAVNVLWIWMNVAAVSCIGLALVTRRVTIQPADDSVEGEADDPAPLVQPRSQR